MRNACILAIIMLLTACMGWVPGRQAYWDAKVKELCEKDGGVTVYERVRITQSEYRRMGGVHGEIPVPSRSLARPGTPYVTDTTIIKLHDWAPEVWRRETLVVRMADGKVLARQVTYGRRGADAPIIIGQPSFYGCSEAGVHLDVEKQTFEIVEDLR